MLELKAPLYQRKVTSTALKSDLFSPSSDCYLRDVWLVKDLPVEQRCHQPSSKTFEAERRNMLLWFSGDWLFDHVKRVSIKPCTLYVCRTIKIPAFGVVSLTLKRLVWGVGCWRWPQSWVQCFGAKFNFLSHRKKRQKARLSFAWALVKEVSAVLRPKAKKSTFTSLTVALDQSLFKMIVCMLLYLVFLISCFVFPHCTAFLLLYVCKSHSWILVWNPVLRWRRTSRHT